MPRELPRIRIFLSSPGDVPNERDIAERAIFRLAGVWKQHLRLETKRWERDHYEAVRSFQTAIGEMGAYDIFIGILWKRIGTGLPGHEFRRADGSLYESGTVFEIETALGSSQAQGRPKVYVFRNTAPVMFSAATVEEDRRQYDQLQNWWNRTFRDAEGHFARGYQTYATLQEFEASVEALVEKLLLDSGLIPAGPAWDVTTRGSPYPGLVPYDVMYSAVFFGRALAVASATEELENAARRGTPAIIIIGPSGSGKSSLARAGLAIQFTDHRIAGVDFWRRVLLEPTEDALLALAQRLYGSDDALPELRASPQATPSQFASLAAQSPEAAANAIKWALNCAESNLQQARGGAGLAPVGRLVLIVDQLETMLDHADRGRITALLRELVVSETTWLIATMRSDRYGDIQADRDLLELRRRGALFDLPSPGPSEIADVIKGPARAANLSFEQREGVSLAEVIRSAVTDADALPLLQMTLKRLFDARAGNTLTYDAYTGMGGLEGAIAAHAEEVFDSVPVASQSRLDAVLRSLVADIDDNGRLTIRTCSQSAWAEDEPARTLVTKMTEARLLVSAGGDVRVAHEALLRHWERARRSPALQPQAIRLRRQIEPAFEVWRNTQLDSDLLQPGTALAAAASIAEGNPGAFPPPIEAYVTRSARAAQARTDVEARRARRRAYAASLAALLLAALTVASLHLYSQASGNFELALLTKADRLLVEQKPTQALVVATALRSSTVLQRVAELIGASDLSGDKAVRIRTIAGITGAASSAPLQTYKNSQPATAGTLSRDGKRLAIGHANGEIHVIPTNAEEAERHRKVNSGRIWSMQFSNNGDWLVSASFQEIVLWNLVTNETEVICDPNASNINAVSLDPEFRYLAWATKDGAVSVRNLHTSEIRRFKEHARWAISVDFSTDGTLLASAGDDGLIVVRRASDWSVVSRLDTSRLDVFSISFSIDGSRIASATLGGEVDVWELTPLESPVRGRSIAVPPDRRWKIKFSPDGHLLALASWQGTITFWDADTYRYRGTIDGNDHRVNDLSFTADGATLLTVVENGTARLWDIRAVRPMFETFIGDDRETIIGKYSPDGTKFLAGGRDGLAKVFVNKDGTWHRNCAVDHKNWIVGGAFSADGRTVVTIAIGDSQTPNHDLLKIWRTEDCVERQASINPEHLYPRSVVFNPQRDEFAWAAREGDIWLVDLRELKRARLPKFHQAAVDEMDVSPDGKLLVSGDQDGRIAVWNLETRTIERELRGHQQGVYTIKFAPDGHTIASAGTEERILVWDLAKPAGQELIRDLPLPGGANRLAFNATGTMLAVGSDARYIAAWSTDHFNKIFDLRTLVGVRSVYGFDPRSGDLAFDGENGLVRILPQASERAGANSAVSARSGSGPYGRLNGIDVQFDDVPFYIAENAKSLPPAELACMRQP